MHWGTVTFLLVAIVVDTRNPYYEVELYQVFQYKRVLCVFENTQFEISPLSWLQRFNLHQLVCDTSKFFCFLGISQRVLYDF